MRKVLLVTYYWPPAGGPGVQRWLFFVKYLHLYGIEPILYIPENPHYPVTDSELADQVPARLKIYRSRFWEPYRLAGLLGRKKTKRISSGIINRKKPGLAERTLLWIRGNLFIPDARKAWVPGALRELPGILETEGISLVITTGPPHSLHLIGLGLKQSHPGINWVADFRDPWFDIGYHSAMYLGRRARKLHRNLENAVLTTADCIVATSRITAARFEKRTRRPVTVITNGFDGDPGDGRQPDGPFVIAHVGSLLSGRNPAALWEALAELVQSEPGFASDLLIELTGLVSPEVLGSLKAQGLEEYARINPYIPHREALDRQKKAQVLLLIEIDVPETTGIVPGKLFEYMAAARPVLAIGPEGWEAAVRVAETGCGAGFTYRDRDAILAQLRQWYDLYGKGRLNVDPSGSGAYHRRELTEKLAREVLWELSADSPS